VKHKPFCLASLNAEARCVCDLKPQPKRLITFKEAVEMLGEEGLKWHLQNGNIKEMANTAGFLVLDESALAPN
jgi:hypothetical protein